MYLSAPFRPRFGGLVGVRLEPSDRVALLISAGGGFEVEDFSAVDVASRSLTVRDETRQAF